MDDRIYCVWLTLAGKVAGRANSIVYGHFGSGKAAYEAGEDEYNRIEGLRRDEIKDYLDKDLSKAENVVFRCAAEKINIITVEDSEYPENVKAAFPLPIVLYYRGSLPEKEQLLITVVGMRECTAYGRSVTEKICYPLSKSGVGIVSGMAKGIDAAALRAAVAAGKRCYAVLGSGVDVIYPKENEKLYNRIIETGGGIISEYPPGSEAKGFHFPQRNRIMAAISSATLITEAAAKSGALITVNIATEYGKDIYATPGSLFSRESDGVNLLLKENRAKAVRNHLDILEDYAGLCTVTEVPVNAKMPREAVGRPPEKKRRGRLKDQENLPKTVSLDAADTGDRKKDLILDLLSETKLNYSEISERSGLAAADVAAILTMLELEGFVRPLAGGYFERLR